MKTLPYVILKVGNKEYKLKISARTAVELEEKLGTTLVAGMADFGKVGTLVEYLWASLKPLNSGVTKDEVYEIYDDLVSSGKNTGDIGETLIEVLTVSGFLKPQTAKKTLGLIKEMEKVNDLGQQES